MSGLHMLAKISLTSVHVGANRRPVSAAKITELANSIKEIGLVNPITVGKREVNGTYELLAGAHRLAACKSLKMDTVSAIVTDLEGLDRELAMIDENLLRNELTALERSEQTARRKEIYEVKYPETKKGGDQKSEEIKEKKSSLRSDPPKPFVEATAEKLGVTPRTVAQDVYIANNLTPEAKDILRDTPAANKKSVLHELAQAPTEKQAELAQAVADKKGSIKMIRAATTRRNPRKATPASSTPTAKPAPFTSPAPALSSTIPPPNPPVKIPCPKLEKRDGPVSLDAEKLDKLHNAIRTFIDVLNYSHGGFLNCPKPIQYHVAGATSLHYILLAYKRIQEIIVPGIATIEALLQSRQTEGEGNDNGNQDTTHSIA